MSSRKTTLLAAGAAVAGILTLRSLRKRRSGDDPEPDAGAEARAEVSEANDHAHAAVSHATAAGEHAVEYAREELQDRSDGTPIEVADDDSPPRRRRIAGRFRKSS